MTFEEDFPSLELVSKEMFYDTVNLNNYVHRENIQEYCIDKQKVKKAINKILVHGHTGYLGDVHSPHCRMCLLLKELGL